MYEMCCMLNVGLMAGIGKGVIRTLKVDVELVGDLIPVDLAVNLMIAAAWSKATENRFVLIVCELSVA